MLTILKTYAVNALIFAVVWVMLVSLWTNSVGKYIYATIAVVSCFFALYGCGEMLARDDKKPYVNRGISIKRSLYMPSILLGVQVVFLLMYKLTWIFGSDGDSIQSIWAVVTNLLSYGWFAPLGAFAGMDKGGFSVLGYILILLISEGGYVLGYYAGAKGFDISEKLFGFMYEKKKK